MSRIPVSRKDRVRSEAKKRRIADQNISAQSLSTTDVNAIIAQYLIDNPVGGSSVGKIVDFESGRIAAGVSGAVLTRTAGVDQYFRIRQLSTTSGLELGVTLTIDGIDVMSNLDLEDASPATTNAASTSFIISERYGSTNTTSAARVLSDVYCTSFTLTRVTGTTIREIDYAYETLEAL